jgi:hypothetical protein
VVKALSFILRPEGALTKMLDRLDAHAPPLRAQRPAA